MPYRDYLPLLLRLQYYWFGLSFSRRPSGRFAQHYATFSRLSLSLSQDIDVANLAGVFSSVQNNASSSLFRHAE